MNTLISGQCHHYSLFRPATANPIKLPSLSFVKIPSFKRPPFKPISSKKPTPYFQPFVHRACGGGQPDPNHKENDAVVFEMARAFFSKTPSDDTYVEEVVILKTGDAYLLKRHVTGGARPWRLGDWAGLSVRGVVVYGVALAGTCLLSYQRKKLFHYIILNSHVFLNSYIFWLAVWVVWGFLAAAAFPAAPIPPTVLTVWDFWGLLAAAAGLAKPIPATVRLAEPLPPPAFGGIWLGGIKRLGALVESLVAKVKVWELEKGMPFVYNKAPLLRTLEEFTISRQEKEEQKRKSREQKKLQEQLATEQEALFGSKSNVKKPLGQSTHANTMSATPNSRRLGTPSHHGISAAKIRRESGKVPTLIPINYVALPKDDRGD